MTTQAPSEAEAPTAPVEGRDVSFAAFLLLRAAFAIAPIAAGIDKYFDWMVDWEDYLSDQVTDVLPWSTETIMYLVGGVEIAAGLLVLVLPHLGGPLVTLWLGAITANLVMVGIDQEEYWDIALRDFGLMLGALSFSMLAFRHRRSARGRRRRQHASRGQSTTSPSPEAT